MDLTLDSEQKQLVQIARQYVTRNFDVVDQGKAVNETPLDRATLVEMAKMGWIGLVIPEEYGGSGGTVVDLALVLEEFGRAAVPTPIVASGALAAQVIIGAGDGERRSELLASIASGETVATVALIAPGASDEWSGQAAVGRRDGADWLLDGRYSLVPYGHEADAIIVRAKLDGRGESLVVLRLPSEGVEVKRQRVIGGEPRASVVLDGVRITDADVLGGSPERVRAVLDGALDVASVLSTAHAVGAAESALQLSVQWAKDRVQFGKPIGSFQTVSNRCADMRLVIDAARLLTWEAAWSLDESRPYAPERVAVAKHYLTDAAELITNNSHQVHGAMGYSTEYPLHVFTRTMKAYQASLGTSGRHLERVAAAIGL